MRVDGLRSPLNAAGVLILVVGLGSAALIWHHHDRLERENEAANIGDAATPLSPLDSRKHIRDVELYSGKLGVLMESAGDLFHGKALAKTIAVVSVLAGGGLLLFNAWINPGQGLDAADDGGRPT